ncbi:MAG TPA: ribose 5-phosphate isomerase B [Ignavibacteriaceae bacterium]|nr:ribose 5-phosphate isomerase B [Ignavibacteriaceae bacterium]
MKKVITERDILELEKQGIKVLVITKDTVITPLALDRIRFSKFTIIEKEIPQSEITHSSDAGNSTTGKRIIIGSDHTGFRIKNILIKYLVEKGYQITDAGTFDEKPCDYPDYAKIVATSVSKGDSDFGILIDATGIPSAIAANKVKGIRAATCYNAFSARSSRAHNNANVLVVGARALGEETIKLIVDEWLSTQFESGRHQKRLDKITDLENGKTD